MKRALLVACIMGTCGLASAESNVCDYSTDFNINIDEQSVLFEKNNGDRFEFKNDQLFINGNSIELSAQQRRASSKLESGARAMVPKVAVVAVEGAELGIKAATMVMTTLFSDDPKAQEELMVPIEAIGERIKQNISKTQLNTEALERSFDEAFDEEFEKMLELAITKYSGKIVGNILTTVFSGDGEELKDLEFRMENLEQDIENYVEQHAAELERKAEALCEDMAELDVFDTQLESVDGYPQKGLFSKNTGKGFKFSSISFLD